MKTKNKVWLGVGAFMVVGMGSAGTTGPVAHPLPSNLPKRLAADTAIPRDLADLLLKDLCSTIAYLEQLEGPLPPDEGQSFAH